MNKFLHNTKIKDVDYNADGISFVIVQNDNEVFGFVDNGLSIFSAEFYVEDIRVYFSREITEQVLEELQNQLNFLNERSFPTTDLYFSEGNY